MEFKESPLYLYSKPDVTLVVGEEQIEVHENVIAVYSGFFKAALNSGFKESHERRIEIHDIELENLTVVLNWLYRVPLTPLFNPDTSTRESFYTLNSPNMVQRLADIHQAFDYFHIKGFELPLTRFIESQFREVGGQDRFVEGLCKNVVTISNNLYKNGYNIDQAYLDILIKAFFSARTCTAKGHMHIKGSCMTELKDALNGLPDPDAKFFKAVFTSMASILVSYARQ
ncbi:hypothetical protein TWF718_002258 [Orbilia javanica]|uniref:BTB domain-containing protein n=1 Tax=Orbilia javanica TaxID=47235 RepID=A0AAN8R9R3_9PEZI